MASERLLRAAKLVLLTALTAAALGGDALSAFRSREPRLVLFDPAPRDPAEIQVGNPGVARSRVVTIDFAALQAALPTGANGYSRPPLLINMFDDLAYNAEVDRVDLFENGFVWVGHVPGYDLSSVTIASVDGVVAGSIVMPEVVFVIRYLGDGRHEIAQLDQSSLPAELVPAPVAQGAGAAAGGQDSSTSPAGVIVHGGTAGTGTIAGPATIVNARLGDDAPPVSSVETASVAPAGAESHAAQTEAGSRLAGPEIEGRTEQEAAKAASRAWHVSPFGALPDRAPGRFGRQPSQDDPGEITADPGTAEAAAPHLSEIAGQPVRTVVTAPENGADVSLPFVLSGSSVDLASTAGAGVDSVQVWAFRVDKDAPRIGLERACSDPGAAGIWLGAAAPVPPGPDGEPRHGPSFPGASYRLDVNTLGPGLYDVLVCPHRASTGRFEGARAVRVTVR